MSKQLLREFVKEILTEKKRKEKPGGPRTDLGAIRQLNPDKFRVQVRTAMKTNAGNVKDAAKDLDVRPRTVYWWLDDDESLKNVQTSSEIEAEKAEEEEKAK